MRKGLFILMILQFNILFADPIMSPYIPSVIQNTFENEWVKAGYYDTNNTLYNKDNLPEGTTIIDVTSYDYLGVFEANPITSDGYYTTAIDWLLNGRINDNGVFIPSPISSLCDSSIVVIYFPEGTYKFNKTILLSINPLFTINGVCHKNIIFKGTGSDKTVLKFCMPIKSGIDNNEIKKLRDSFRIQGISDLSDSSSNYVPYIDQITNEFINNIGLEDFCIIREDLNLEFEKAHNIRFFDANNCWVIGVECNETHGHQIVAERSKHITISGCFLQNAKSNGEGGYGYGISLDTFTHHCLIENNIIKRLRHGLIVQNGAHYNVFGYNYVLEGFHNNYKDNTFMYNFMPREDIGDIVCHGRAAVNEGVDDNYLNYLDGPYGNLFEGNIGGWIWIDTFHDKNGLDNTFLRNRASKYGFTSYPDLNKMDCVITWETILYTFYTAPTMVEAELLYNLIYYTFNGVRDHAWPNPVNTNPDDTSNLNPRQNMYNNYFKNKCNYWKGFLPPNWWNDYLLDRRGRKLYSYVKEYNTKEKWYGFWGSKSKNHHSDNQAYNFISAYRIIPNPFTIDGSTFNAEHENNKAKYRNDKIVKKTVSRVDSEEYGIKSYIIDSNLVIPDDITDNNNKFNGDLYIPKDCKLIINPGVTVKFRPGASIIVEGALQAEGTIDQKITFTSINSDSKWNGIQFIHNQKQYTESIFENCLFENYEKTLDDTLVIDSTYTHGGNYEYHTRYIYPEKFNVPYYNLFNSAVSEISDNSYSVLDINNCTFKNNISYKEGGALSLKCLLNSNELNTNETVIVNINESKFINNTANKRGGAIYSSKTCLDIKNCIFQSNASFTQSNNDFDGFGGAIYTEEMPKHSTLKLVSNQFYLNESAYGAAVYTVNADSGCIVLNNSFISNTSKFNGSSLIFNNPVTEIKIINNIFEKNAINGYCNSTSENWNNLINCGRGNIAIELLNANMNNINYVFKNNNFNDNHLFSPQGDYLDYFHEVLLFYRNSNNSIRITDTTQYTEYTNNYYQDPKLNRSNEYGCFKFQLNPDSPLIDDGLIPFELTEMIPDNDVIGNPRICNNLIDIGANEYKLPYPILQVINDESVYEEANQISFPSTFVGKESSICLKICNYNVLDTLQINQITLSQVYSFTQTVNYPLQIPINSELDLNLKFKPVSFHYNNDYQNDTLKIYYGEAIQDTVYYRLNGIALEPCITLSDTSTIRFNNQTVVNPQNYDEKNLVVKNTGNSPLIISAITASSNFEFYYDLNNSKNDSNSNPIKSTKKKNNKKSILKNNKVLTHIDYKIINYNKVADSSWVHQLDSLIVQPLDSIALKIRFKPIRYGNIYEDLIIHSNDYDDSLTIVSLSGYGLSPEIDGYTLTPYNFGSVPANNDPNYALPLTFNLQNVGTTDLIISSMNLSDPYILSCDSVHVINSGISKIRGKSFDKPQSKRITSSLNNVGNTDNLLGMSKVNIFNNNLKITINDNKDKAVSLSKAFASPKISTVTIPPNHEMNVSIYFKPYLLGDFNTNFTILSNDVDNDIGTGHNNESSITIPLIGNGRALNIPNDLNDIISSDQILVCPEINVNQSITINPSVNLIVKKAGNSSSQNDEYINALPVKISFAEDCSININGKLSVYGTSGNPVIFCGLTSNGWLGLLFNNIDQNQKSTINGLRLINKLYSESNKNTNITTTKVTENYSKMNNIRSKEDVLREKTHLDHKAISLSNNVNIDLGDIIFEDFQYGIYLNDNSKLNVQTGTKLNFNNTIPNLNAFYVSSLNTYPEIDPASVKLLPNSQEPIILINGGTLTIDKIINNYGFTNHLLMDLTVSSQKHLQLMPGLKIKTETDKKIIISGRLSAIGSESDPISLISVNNINGWSGLKFLNSNETNESVLDFCDISESKGSGINFLNSSNITVKNSKIHHNIFINGSGGGVFIESSLTNIENNRIYSNSSMNGGGIYIKGFSAKSNPSRSTDKNINLNTNSTKIAVSTLSITRNYIYENSATYGGGLYIVYTQNSTKIDNNVVAKNNSSVFGDGIYINNSPTLGLIHNTITENTGNHYEVYLSNSANTTFKYNIIYDINSGNNQINSGVLDYNLIYSTTSLAPGTTNITYNPDFIINPEIGKEYSLQATSPCIDAGIVNDYLYSDRLDKSGKPRLNCHNVPVPDFGAYEFYGEYIQIGQEQITEYNRLNQRIFAYKNIKITNDITIALNKKLIIKPGVKLDFINQSKMNIIGEIEAKGEANRLIEFSTSDSYWKGLIIDNGTSNYNYFVELKFCSFSKSISDENGGALRLNNINHNISLANCIFENNESKRNGGAVYISHTTYNSGFEAVINTCTFKYNKTNCSNYNSTNGFGGAIYINKSKFKIDSNSIFENNTTQKYYSLSGGAISILGSSSGSIKNSIFLNNIANSNGGSIYTKSTITIEANAFTSSKAFAYSVKDADAFELNGGGGAIYAEGCSPIIKSNTIQSCSGFNGGGIALNTCTSYEISNNTLSQNYANSNIEDLGGSGGGIFINSFGSTTTSIVKNNKIIDSSSLTRKGGGLFIKRFSLTYISTPELQMYNNLIANNKASYGAGIYCLDSSIKSFNNTIVNNHALSNLNQGGAIFYKNEISPNNTITFNITNSIITANKSMNTFNNFNINPNVIINKLNLNNFISENGSDPGFVSINTNNYQLNPSATDAINKGNNIFYLDSINSTFDQAGRNRLSATLIDVGCYEFNASYNISSDIVENTTWDQDYVMVREPISILNGVTLTIASNTTVVISGDGPIYFMQGSNLILGNNVSFVGINPSVDHLKFEGLANQIVNFNYSNFSAINLFFSTYILKMNYCNLFDTKIESEKSMVTIKNSIFVRSFVNANSNFCDEIVLTNNIFNGTPEFSHCVYIQGYSVFLIEGNTMENVNNTIFIQESGYSGKGSIKNNILKNNNTLETIGVDSYHSSMQIIGNNLIRDGLIGIRASGMSLLSIIGNKTDNFQYIRDNSEYELDFTFDSLPISKYNFIWDESTELNPILIRCKDYTGSQLLEMNDCRGDIDDINRVEPQGFITGTWDNGIIIDPSEELYISSCNLMINELYVDAIDNFKLLINTYPNTVWSKYALDQILICENKMQAKSINTLKSYYESIHINSLNQDLANKSDYLANYCNILLGDYYTAINWYENKLNNSPSLQDSIYAVIDLGFIYLLMNDNQTDTKNQEKANNPLSNRIIPKYNSYRPASKYEYYKAQMNLLNLLFSKKNTDPEITPDLGIKKLELQQNYPNPFNPITTISFNIPKQSWVTLEIFNIKGQKVKCLKSEFMSIGKYTVIWDGKDYKGNESASGVYFYKLKTESNTIAKKMLLIK